jgi:hypothetical protein
MKLMNTRSGRQGQQTRAVGIQVVGSVPGCHCSWRKQAHAQGRAAMAAGLAQAQEARGA